MMSRRQPMKQRPLRTQIKPNKTMVRRSMWANQPGPKKRSIYFVRSTHKTRAGAEKRATELKGRGYDAHVKARRVGAYKYKVMQRVLWL